MSDKLSKLKQERAALAAEYEETRQAWNNPTNADKRGALSEALNIIREMQDDLEDKIDEARLDSRIEKI